MKKIPGVLSALLGAGLMASLTLNVCFYRKFISEKPNRTGQSPAGRKKPVLKKEAQTKKQKIPGELILLHTGRYGHDTVYARFHVKGSESLEFINLSRDRISIRPALPFTVSSDPWYDHIRIKADFQPETVYTFGIRKGLKNEKGDQLSGDAEFQIRFPARPTRLKALSSGLVFPEKRPNRNLPLELCNLDEIQVAVLKLYENNLLRFSAESDWSGNIQALDYGKEIVSRTIPVKIPRNQKVNYALDLNPLLPPGQPGVYGLILTPADRKKTGPSVQLAIAVTDLAPQCVIDRLNRQAFTAVRHLSDGSPCPGAKVTLVSSKFQTLASGVTDGVGLIRLDYSRSPAGTDPKDYPNALLVQYGRDTVFRQNLLSQGHSLAEFDSAGNRVSARPRALVYTERGVYRPGEKIQATAWIRNSDLSVYADAPCLLKVEGPSGNAIHSEKLKSRPDGLIHTVFRLPEDAPGGWYTVRCQAADESEAWGSAGFLAADFLPDRIKVNLQPSATELSAGPESVDFTFAAEYYFGGGTDQSPYRFTVSGAPAADRPAWKGWTVGSREFSSGRRFSRSGKMTGKAVKVTYPGFTALRGKAFRPVALHAEVQVSEPGGRAVSAHSSVIYHPTPYYLGLRQKSDRDQVVLDWKFFPADPKQTVPLKNRPIELSVFRHEWKQLLKKNQGKLTREWVKEKVPVCKKILDPVELQKGEWREKLSGGSYEIAAVCGPMRTDISFWHWYGEGGARSINPAVISCTTDREIYRPGETAQVALDSAADGFALIAVGDLKLAGYQEYPIRKGRNILPVKLPPGIQTSGCYAGITLLSGEQRRFGLIRFKIKQDQHKLVVQLDAPETAMPLEKINVGIKLTSPDGQPQSGTVQLFAVDEGILALTQYAVPDIFNYFYGVYHCDFIFTDVYGQLYPDLKIGPDGRIGGDASESGGRKGFASLGSRQRDIRRSFPQSAVRMLPPVTVNGAKNFEIALPDHSGAMRLMAVASGPLRTGSAERTLKMRDRLDILPTVPPLCAPGDETELTFALFNHDLPSGKARLELSLPDGKKVAAEPVLAIGKQTVFRTTAKLPGKEGVYPLTVLLEKDGIIKRKTVLLPVRLPNPAVTHTVFHALKPGEKWVSGGRGGIPAFAADAEYSLTVSGSCASGLKDAVAWLNHYPYGCLEQTVSSAFPFLSAAALEKCGVITPAMAETAKVKVNLAAAKIRSMMLYNGAFPMWPGGLEEWTGGTVYAAHFLTASGNLRDSKPKKLLADRLKSLVQQASAARYERAYACWVLALMKTNPAGFLTGARNLLKSQEDDFASFLAAAALLEAGYSGEAYPHLKRLLAREIWRTDSETPHFAGAAARAGMTLYILVKLQANVPETIAKLRRTLLNQLKSNGSGWGVTHANAWAVLGLAELERGAGTEKSAARVSLPEGTMLQPDLSGTVPLKLRGPEPVTVENTGNTPLYVQYRIHGVPVQAEPVRGALRIQRVILRNGKPVNSAEQGELLTVRIRIHSSGAVKDMVLSDLLPGGLEIEDERFATRAKSAPRRPKETDILTVKQWEKRPGEFVLSGDLRERGRAEITYQVRAVSRGRYALGSTSAEAMYEPGTRAFEPGYGVFEVK